MSTFMVKNFLKYSVIFQEGSKGECAYLLKEGRVEISKILDGKKKVLAVLKPVSIFGEMAILLGDERRTATAVSLEDSKVVEIKKSDFEDYMRKSPQMISTILNVMVYRLKTATAKAMRVPNLFLGIVNVLDLMGKSGAPEINYLNAVNTLSTAFNTPGESVEKAIQMLADDGLLSVLAKGGGEKSLVLADPGDFLGRVMAKRKAGE
ncbi:MAG: cyclic nucleotide-binding domain-containing protein [Thermodesulfobacteriota bacterium]